MILPFGKVGLAFVQAIQSLSSEDEKLAWEATSVSSYSPGPIADDEILIRCCDQPLHLNEFGELKPTAFTDVEGAGLSVNRETYTSSTAELWIAADSRVAVAQARRALEGKAFQPRQAMALVRWTAGAIRHGFDSDAWRHCGTFDTAKADDVSHADVVALRASKEASRAARAWLYQQAKDRLIARPADALQASKGPPQL